MTKNRFTGCLFVGIALLLLICAGAGGWFYLRSRTSGVRAFIQIRNPESGILTSINESLPLNVYTEANRDIQRLEVYADGALVGAANGKGQKNLLIVQSWTPTTPGRHVLLARAFYDAETFSDSSAVFVDTADLSALPIQVNVDDLVRSEGLINVSVKDMAAAAGITPEELARLNPFLPPDPEAVIPPGTPLSLPRRASPPAADAPVIPPPAPGAPGSPAPSPADPRFEGETHTCSQISLRWTDAPDESTYRLYRLAPGRDVMELLATLPANSTSYSDPFIPRIGAYRYFLVPVRPGGEGISSMITVEIGPECAPAGAGATTSLRLLMLNLTTQEAFDGVYCYASINGSRYERLPADPGLLRPTSGNLSYDLPLQLPTRGQYSLSVPSDGLVRLEGECWGRRGAESLRIGRFSGSHASAEWDGRDLTGELALAPGQQLASISGIPASAGGASFLRYRIAPASSRFDLSQIAPGVLQSLYVNVPAILDPLEGTDTLIPPPTNVRIENVGICEDLPTTDPNVGFSVCHDALLTPMIRWNWSGNSFYRDPDVLAWRVNVSFINDQLRNPAPVPGPSLLVVPPVGGSLGRSVGVPPVPTYYACGATVRITVTTITARGDSLPSQPLDLPQPACSQLGQVRITVQSLTISPSARSGQVLDQGDICILCADRRLELFGDLFIGVHNAAPSFSNPPSHNFGTLLSGGCPRGTACLNEGRYQWGSSPHRAPWLFEMEAPAQSLGSAGELTLTAVLADYDTDNGPDNFCVASATLPARNKSEWTRINETVVLTSDLGEAACRIEILVQGIP